MCGIAGLIGIPQGIGRTAALRMRDALVHRGPDAHGYEMLMDPSGKSPPAHFIHTRLSILDLSDEGRQPMRDPFPNSKRSIIFNGEIYNFQLLRDELRTQVGIQTHTGTDTEIILHAYRVWHNDALTRLRGMFAFALADPETSSILLARDRLGIKPLYLYRPSTGGLIFASEVRALLAAGPELVPAILNESAVESFLAQGAVFGLQSHIRGVHLLPPGVSIRVDWDGQNQISHRYWNPTYSNGGHSKFDRAQSVAELGRTVREAVKQHLIADVPVGVFLSSGVDSTAVATLATEAAIGQVRTVSIGFDRPEYDETSIAEQFARELGTNHTTVRLSSLDILKDFENVLAAIDQPTVDGFNTYYVSRAARQAGLKVALSGLGGDELFGGYRTFRDVPRAVRFLKYTRMLRWTGPLFSAAAKGLQLRSLLKASESLRRTPGPVDMYLLRREVFLPAERRALHPLPANIDDHSGMIPADLERWQQDIAHLDPENQVSYLELTGYMRHMLLRDSDVFSMAHGLELRVPLLDHELVDLATSLPGMWKRLGRVPKPLLIDSVGARLPKKVTSMPKRGFTFPWADWFRNSLSTLAAERLNDRGVWSRLGFDPAAPGRMWDLFRRGDPRLGGVHILGLVVLADLASRQKLTAA